MLWGHASGRSIHRYTISKQTHSSWQSTTHKINYKSNEIDQTNDKQAGNKQKKKNYVWLFYSLGAGARLWPIMLGRALPGLWLGSSSEKPSSSNLKSTQNSRELMPYWMYGNKNRLWVKPQIDSALSHLFYYAYSFQFSPFRNFQKFQIWPHLFSTQVALESWTGQRSKKPSTRSKRLPIKQLITL